jgi:hypothetical protein
MALHERRAARHVSSVHVREHRRGRPVDTRSRGSFDGFQAVAKPKRPVQEVTVLGNTGLIVVLGAIRSDWAGRSIKQSRQEIADSAITAGANWLRHWSALASSPVCSDRHQLSSVKTQR